MENNTVERTVPEAGNDGLQVSEAAEVAAGEEIMLENGGGADEDEGTTVTEASGGGGSEFRAKGKRGRPRKELVEMRREFMAVPEFPATLQKRGRGRPRGSGKWQMLAASLGGSAGDTGGSNFTPHIISVQEGENIVERIWSFSQMTSDSICILSASGTISRAEIFIPAATPGSVLRYEGQFSIVLLNGSHTYEEKKGGKICLLSVQLAYPDGHLCGGAVAGSLIAAGPTQITIATFRQKLTSQPSTKPHYLSSPNPSNNGAFATAPMHAENGQPSDGEMRVLTTTQRVDEVVLNGPNVIQSSSGRPVDWKPLQPSASG